MDNNDYKVFFSVNVTEYVPFKDFSVYRPSSLENPKNNSVMMVTTSYLPFSSSLLSVKECLVFWPKDEPVPIGVGDNHAVVCCENPHLEYCQFFKNHNISNLPRLENFEFRYGSFFGQGSTIGVSATVFPGCLIGSEVSVGDNVFIGSGTRINGKVVIGRNVIIRENCVIGADGLSTDRDINGKAVTMPQFGGVIIENDVSIGANTVICRGAIDNTVIKSGSKIDNSCFISHNVVVGEDSFIVGETIMFGSSSTGKRTYISGNSTIRNKVHIGDNSMVGMGSVVTKSVPENSIVIGNPARLKE